MIYAIVYCSICIIHQRRDYDKWVLYLFDYFILMDDIVVVIVVVMAIVSGVIIPLCIL